MPTLLLTLQPRLLLDLDMPMSGANGASVPLFKGWYIIPQDYFLGHGPESRARKGFGSCGNLTRCQSVHDQLLFVQPDAKENIPTGSWTPTPDKDSIL